MASLNSPVSSFACPTKVMQMVAMRCVIWSPTGMLDARSPHFLRHSDSRKEEFAEVSPVRHASGSTLLPQSSVDHENLASTLSQERGLRTSSMF